MKQKNANPRVKRVAFWYCNIQLVLFTPFTQAKCTNKLLSFSLLCAAICEPTKSDKCLPIDIIAGWRPRHFNYVYYFCLSFSTVSPWICRCEWMKITTYSYWFACILYFRGIVSKLPKAVVLWPQPYSMIHQKVSMFTFPFAIIQNKS